MSTPNNRRRDPGGMGGEAILLWVGIVAVVVLGGAVYGSVRLGHAIAGDGAELPSDPFALVFGVFSGNVSWPAASWCGFVNVLWPRGDGLIWPIQDGVF